VIQLRENISCDCHPIHDDIIEKVKSKMKEDKEIDDLSRFFKTIGDGTRLRILLALSESEMCGCDLAVLLDMTKSAISHQLRNLRKSNLVKSRREGKIVFYSLCDDNIRSIFEKAFEHIK
jgi:ArsR family transcriptional regulator